MEEDKSQYHSLKLDRVYFLGIQNGAILWSHPPQNREDELYMEEIRKKIRNGKELERRNGEV